MLLDNFGSDVPIWATFNEPIAVYVGYALGSFAPGLRDEEYARQSLHNLLVCHGRAVQLFLSYRFPDSRIGIVRTDYETQKRTVKDSGRWYSRMIADNGFTME